MLILGSVNVYGYVGPGHVTGPITNLTSTSGGVLIRIGSNEVPENCTSELVWMEIKQEKTAMVSVVLLAWTLGRSVDVYTSPSSSGYCEINQVDPREP